MRVLTSLIIFLVFSGSAFAALPEVHLAENVVETYEKRVTFRRIIKALLRSRQCEPRSKEVEILGGLESDFGCMILYRDEWYGLFFDFEAGYSLLRFDDRAWDDFLLVNDGFFRYRSKRRRYPQFRGSRPQKWFRFTTMSARKMSLKLRELLQDFNARVEATENEYYALYDIYFPEDDDSGRVIQR